MNLLVRPTDSFENQTIFQIERDRRIGSAPFAIHDFNMSSAFNATAQRQATANGMTLAQFNAARDYILALQDRIGPYRIQGWSLGCPATATSPATPSKIPGPNIANVIPNPCAPSRGWQRPAILINKTTWEFTENLSVKNIFGARWNTTKEGLANSDNTRLILRDTNPKNIRTHGTSLSDFGDWTDEVQLVGSNLLGGRLDFVTGFFHSRFRTPHLEPTYTQYSFNVNDTVTSAFVDDKTNAVYGQADFDVTDRLTLTAGVRNTWDYSIRTNYVLNPTTFAVTSVRGGPGTPDGEGSWTALSYTLGARYQLNDDTMFFITNSKGHSAGGLQNVAGNEKFDPDSLNNIEVGAKTTFDLGSALSVRVNAAAHYGWFDDVKVAQLILTTIPGTTGTTFVSATTNAAKAIVKGADLDVTTVVPSAWK